MTLPGFTAEASLYSTKDPYRAAKYFASILEGGKVLPLPRRAKRQQPSNCPARQRWSITPGENRAARHQPSTNAPGAVGTQHI